MPGGGNLADGILAALTIAFLVIIGVMGLLLYRQNRLAYMTLDDRRRLILIGAIGAIVLMIAGTDELLDTGAGHPGMDRRPGPRGVRHRAGGRRLAQPLTRLSALIPLARPPFRAPAAPSVGRA